MSAGAGGDNLEGEREDGPDAHALLDVGRRDAVSEGDDKLGDLLDVDDVLVLLVGVGLLARRERGRRRVLVELEDLCAARHLERVLLAHALLVGREVPQVGRREARRELLDACERASEREGVSQRAAARLGEVREDDDAPIFSLTRFWTSLMSFSASLRRLAYGPWPCRVKAVVSDEALDEAVTRLE